MSSTLDYLRDLVAFDTRNGTGDEVACVTWLAKALSRFAPDQLIQETVPRSRGKPDSAYVLAIWGRPKALLNVHIDTVPSGEGWTADPLTLVQRGNHVHGLGTSDIKGAAAAILGALQTTTPRNVAVLLSGDEEAGSEVMPAIIRSGHLAAVERAVVCEPTSCRVGRAHRGMLAMHVRYAGPGGHSSLADTLAAPLLNATQFCARLGDYRRDHRDFGHVPFKGLCVNIGEVTSDGAYNVIPTTASAKVSMRPPPGDSVAARESDMRAMALSVSSEAEIDTIVAFAPFASQNIGAFTALFDDPVVDLPYWTEASMLSAAGINAIVYGPGNLEQAHRPDEYVALDQLQVAQNRYAQMLAGGLS